MKITAYKCSDTGNLFERYKDYTAHRRKYLKEQARLAGLKQLSDNYTALVQELNNSATSLDYISNWIINTHSDAICARFNTDFAVKSISWLDIRVLPVCSNSHSAPRGGVTNWARDHNTPMGYPGLVGTIVFTYAGNNNKMSDIFKSLGINFGSGGGSGNRYKIGVTLFESDWPVLIPSINVLKVLTSDTWDEDD